MMRKKLSFLSEPSLARLATLPPHPAAHQEASPLPFIPHLGSHAAAILLCSRLKQLQGYPHHGRVTVQKSVRERRYRCGHLWRMQSAKHPPPPRINRGLRSLLKRSGWQGRKQEEMAFCHNHPCFFKEQGNTPSMVRLWRLLSRCLPRSQENRIDRAWLVCPSQPAERRCEMSFRVVVLCCSKPQTSVVPFKSSATPLLWGHSVTPLLLPLPVVLLHASLLSKA